MKVLIIEDEQSIIDAVNMAFEFRWPDVKLVSSLTGKEGINLVRKERPDVIILDINLPDISGFSVLKKIREFSEVPIIILTVRSEDTDVLKGLETGADDYIVKPFNYLTLLARIQAVLRRTSKTSLKEDNTTISPHMKIDFINQKISVDDRLVRLTPVEYRLLLLLVKNKGWVVPYKKITQEIWGNNDNKSSENIRISIQRLRHKLKDNPPTMIINERGRGYIFKG